jgi:tRNA (guanine-N7-)-methyltransferase
VADTEQAAPVRTYHARRGRLSTSHRQALSLGGSLLLDAQGLLLDLGAVAEGREVIVDIGCGMGESAIAQAAVHPEHLVVAIDVHTRGIATLLREAERRSVTNLKAVLGDAVGFLTTRVADQTLSGARIYFPDPWPKARHNKRRLVQPAFVAMLAERLLDGAFVHCTTDDIDYAQQMHQVFASSQKFHNPHSDFAPSALGRPTTKYERRALRDGRQIFDVWVTRRLRL